MNNYPNKAFFKYSANNEKIINHRNYNNNKRSKFFSTIKSKQFYGIRSLIQEDLYQFQKSVSAL